METAVLGAGAGERVLDLGLFRRRPVSLAEDLGDDEGEDVGRPSEPVDPRRVDREVERAPPALPAELDLDQAVVGIDLVLGVVVEAAEPAEGGLGLFQPAQLEREVADLEARPRLFEYGVVRTHAPRACQTEVWHAVDETPSVREVGGGMIVGDCFIRSRRPRCRTRARSRPSVNATSRGCTA